jgi:two-component system, NtrC family, nitrogen regulation sensor histidine kinase NtrY
MISSISLLRLLSVRRVLAGILLAAGVIAGGYTYVILSNLSPETDTIATLNILFIIDLTILAGLGALVGQHIWRLFRQRRHGLAGSSLHIQTAGLVAALVMVPTLLVTIFSLLFFHYGLQTWFSDQVKTAIEESRVVADSYLREHQQVIRADILAMANDLDRESGLLLSGDNAFSAFVNTQARLRNLTEAMVFTAQDRKIIGQSDMTFSLTATDVAQEAITRAEAGDVVLLTGEGGSDDRIQALVKLRSLPDVYLFVGRLIDANVLGRVLVTQEAADRYAQLEQFTDQIKRTLMALFAVVALLLLLIALWFGLTLSERLISPIEGLIAIAGRVRDGDLTARLPDEFISLAKAFNRMTDQIAAQQTTLMTANREMDARRRLIEAILTGVSSGVIGLDTQGNITHCNTAGADILGLPASVLVGQTFTKFFPEAALDTLLTKKAEVPITRADGRQRAISMQATMMSEGDAGHTIIVTFDDITDLKTAQRATAWGEVARRIAHEIRNPLTPIQLSAERLNRRYADLIPEDGRKVFQDCIQTISKHVDDIGQMVTEFAQFARMPQAQKDSVDVQNLLSGIVTLQREAYPNIDIQIRTPKSLPILKMHADAGQIRQAMTNVIKNAIEAMQGVNTAQLAIHLATHDGKIALIFNDNGPGFPPDVALETLLEPYITHKNRGTGLGLAIVRKIVEDHGGTLLLGTNATQNAVQGRKTLSGALVTLIFPMAAGG